MPAASSAVCSLRMCIVVLSALWCMLSLHANMGSRLQASGSAVALLAFGRKGAALCCFQVSASQSMLTCAALRLQAFGNAAMLLASGKKGCRFALPHARIMTAPPRLNRSFGAAPNIMIKANELENSTRVYTELLAKATGAPHSCAACRRAALQRMSAEDWLYEDFRCGERCGHAKVCGY